MCSIPSLGTSPSRNGTWESTPWSRPRILNGMPFNRKSEIPPSRTSPVPTRNYGNRPLTGWWFIGILSERGGRSAYCQYHSSWILLVPTWILRLPIALLRLSVVVGNTTLRTMAILALLLAASSIATASILIASKEQLNSATKSDRWIDASRCPKLLSSIDFWTCLTWPITSFVWWVMVMQLTYGFMISGPCRSVLLSLLVIISLAVLVQLDIGRLGAAKSDVAPAIIS